MKSYYYEIILYMEGPTELVNNEDPIEFVKRKKTKKRKSRKNKRKSRKIIKRKKTNRRGRKNKRRTNKRRLRGGCGCAGEGFAGGSVLIPVGGNPPPAQAQALAQAGGKSRSRNSKRGGSVLVDPTLGV